MSKRYSDTATWRKEWFRKLMPAEKSAWAYLLSECDNVGVIKVDFEQADFLIGEHVDWESFPAKVNGNIQVLDNGKWWLTDFCFFQYGDLTVETTNRARLSHIALLQKHGLWDNYVACMRQPCHNHIPKEKDKDKEKAKEQDKEQEKSVAKGRAIYHLILNAFTARNGDTEFNFKREGPHVLALEKKANDRDDPEGFAKAVLVTFWRLTHSEDKFWRKQPFLPSALNAGGIWPRVLKELENMQADAMSPEVQEIIGGLWK